LYYEIIPNKSDKKASDKAEIQVNDEKVASTDTFRNAGLHALLLPGRNYNLQVFNILIYSRGAD
jgi:hypothetical protein